VELFVGEIADGRWSMDPVVLTLSDSNGGVDVQFEVASLAAGLSRFWTEQTCQIKYEIQA
jgi:hypothetical protein